MGLQAVGTESADLEWARFFFWWVLSWVGSAEGIRLSPSFTAGCGLRRTLEIFYDVALGGLANFETNGLDKS